MELNYDPLWDENGELRRGCTVREASPSKIPLHCARLRFAASGIRSAPFPPALPTKSADFVGAPMPAVADKPIFRICDGYYRQLNFCV